MDMHGTHVRESNNNVDFMFGSISFLRELYMYDLCIQKFSGQITENETGNISTDNFKKYFDLPKR